ELLVCRGELEGAFGHQALELPRVLRQFVLHSYQRILGPLAPGDVVKAVDGAGDLALGVFEGDNIDDHGDARGIRPLDDDLSVADLGYFPIQHPNHRTSLGGEETAVRQIHFGGAAIAIPRIVDPWGTAPQLHRVLVEVLDRPGGIAGIDGNRAEIEQHAKTFFAGDQLLFKLLAFGDVTKLALDDLVPVLIVEIADEFHVAALAVPGFDRQVIVVDDVLRFQPVNSLTTGVLVLEQADLPQLFFDQFLSGIPEQFDDEGIGIGDFLRGGIE